MLSPGVEEVKIHMAKLQIMRGAGRAWGSGEELQQVQIGTNAVSRNEE